jgi:UDP-N-acetylmuramyl pentapeptide synthase
MTAAILRAHYGMDAVLATEGNLNNAIGLPLTLLRLSQRDRAAVVELGMNHRGETRELAALARPTIAVVNNAQREHQEFMTSVDEVAAEHADAVLALRSG